MVKNILFFINLRSLYNNVGLDKYRKNKIKDSFLEVSSLTAPIDQPAMFIYLWN